MRITKCTEVRILKKLPNYTTGATLKEIKMKRVENFLKERLGVECCDDKQKVTAE